MTVLRPTVFFDCDGVLNLEPGPPGVLRPEQVALLPGAGGAVARTNAAGWLAIGITNRAQVGKGLVTLDVLRAILSRLETLLANEGGRLDALYFCPHCPPPGPPGADPALVAACDCRKPMPGLLHRAAAEWPIDRSRAVMIGDSQRDIGAAHAFGIPALGVRSGHACADGVIAGAAADRMFDTVVQAVEWVLSDQSALRRTAGLSGLHSSAPR